MKNYQLIYFEKLIRQVLPPQIRKLPKLDQNSLSRIIESMEDEKNYFTNNFGNHLCDFVEEGRMEWYVQLHQQRLILLMDLVTVQMPPNEIKYIDDFSNETSWSNLYKIIYHQLLELLTFLEREYTRYLDIDIKIPVSYLIRSQQHFDSQLPVMSASLVSIGIDEELLCILLRPFQEFITATHQGAFITYHRLFYLNELLKKLSALITTSTAEQLQELLVYLNFNTVHYLKYATTVIAREIEVLPTIQLRLTRLIWLQKGINQMPVKAGLSYNKLHNGLKQQLQEWLSDEICYHKEKEQISGSPIAPEELQQWMSFKVNTTFSVPELGHLVKLLCDSGIFLNKNKKELLAFFSFFFTSIQKDYIAPGSLLKTYYEKNAGVSRSVREKLLDLVNRSHTGATIIIHFILFLF